MTDSIESIQNDEVIRWISRVDPDLMDDFERLHRLLSLLDQYQRERWQRHVSAGDSLIDRWSRARQLGFGEGSSVYDTALVIGEVTVGRNTWIGPNSVLDGSGGLVVGDNCSISAGAQIYSHDTVRWTLSGGDIGPDRRSTSIGSKTYIGPNTVVVMGVSIGRNCIIGAGSLVLADVPGGVVAYGTPARVAGKVEEYLARRELDMAGPA
jgi:acetyltransferase-like isoleucine patch superfamily enzyme